MAMPVLVQRIIDAYRRGPREAAWERFLNDPTPGLADLQAAFGRIRSGTLSESEQRIIERIERRRAQLRQCESVATYRDFGAGDPDAPRTDRQLIEGVVVQRRVGDLVQASVPRAWGLVLFGLIRQFRPARLIELGSAMGISGSYQVAGLWLNDEGNLHTLEGCPQMAQHARQSLAGIAEDRATLVCGRFQDTLDGVLSEMGHVDFAFIDGHHDERATVDYFDRIKPRLTENSVVVFDDCDWSGGMQRAWKHVCADGFVGCALDLGKFGVCLCRADGFGEPVRFELAYPQA
ncbi:MAG: O-methyltransferase [Phycisphaerae bacterium]